MERKIERIDGSHDRCHNVCQSTSERDKAERYVLREPVRGFYNSVQWVDGMAFAIEPKPGVILPADDVQDLRDLAATLPEEAKVTLLEILDQKPGRVRKLSDTTATTETSPDTAALDKLSDADLDTKAAEVGVKVKEDGPKGKRFSRAKIVADVAAAMAKAKP